MALSSSKVAEVVKEFQQSETDTGSTEVQVALLTARIKHLTEHLKINKKDTHSRHGLLQMVSDRRSLLKYLKANEKERYKSLIEKLGIRDLN